MIFVYTWEICNQKYFDCPMAGIHEHHQAPQKTHVCILRGILSYYRVIYMFISRLLIYSKLGSTYTQVTISFRMVLFNPRMVTMILVTFIKPWLVSTILVRLLVCHNNILLSIVGTLIYSEMATFFQAHHPRSSYSCEWHLWASKGPPSFSLCPWKWWN